MIMWRLFFSVAFLCLVSAGGCAIDIISSPGCVIFDSQGNFLPRASIFADEQYSVETCLGVIDTLRAYIDDTDILVFSIPLAPMVFSQRDQAEFFQAAQSGHAVFLDRRDELLRKNHNNYDQVLLDMDILQLFVQISWVEHQLGSQQNQRVYEQVVYILLARHGLIAREVYINYDYIKSMYNHDSEQPLPPSPISPT